MKSSTVPELSARWWTSQQPDAIGSARDLEKALAEFESAHARLQKDPAAPAHLAAALKALATIETSARKVQDEAAKLAKTPPRKTSSSPDDYQATADVMKRYPKVVDTARKAAQALADEAAAAEDEEEGGDALLTDPQAYQRYLKKVMGRLQSRSMNFALGLGKTGADHRFLFHASKGGKSLAGDLKSRTELKRFAWGVAGGHAERPGVLVLALESPPGAGLASRAEKLLKQFKPLPFGKVLLMVEGEETADIPDPEDTDDAEGAAPAATPPAEAAAPARDPQAAAAFKARLAALLPGLQKAAARHPAADEARARATEAGEKARQQDFIAAHRLLDELERLLAAPTPDAGSLKATDGALPGTSEWEAARDRVLAEVRKVAAAFAATKDPLAKPAIIELQSIVKNLGSTPSTLQQVAEIERYLKEDDVITAAEQVRPPFGTLSIRRPLLRALGALRA